MRATVGHLRDLPTRELGVESSTGSSPSTSPSRARTKTLSELKKAAQDASTQVYLATDPDREGEAIAWHVAEQLKSQRCSDASRSLPRDHQGRDPARPSPTPGEIDEQKVDAQQARRILDRLVGYKASPILWKSIKTGLSAGRVQTVALRLHRRAGARHPRVRARRSTGPSRRSAPRTARPSRPRSPRSMARSPSIRNEADARSGVVDAVRGRPFEVTEVEKRQRRKNPARAVHHQHAPAGSRQEARASARAHDARGAGSLRGHGRRRRRAGGSHHVHAHRLAARVSRQRWRRCATSSGRSTGRRISPSRANIYGRQKSARTRRTRTRPSAPPTVSAGRSRSSTISSPTSSGSTSSSGSASWPRR